MPVTEEIDKEFKSRRYRIYILGAGFSRPAGLPLALELWDEIRRRGQAMTGRASSFSDDLETYIEYRKDCDGIELTPEQIDFEDFLAFLDVEHYLGLRGKDTWSYEGNETQVLVKTLIGEILTSHMPPKDRVPELYLRFTEILKPHDFVLTFNYDVLLERALEAKGIPFRLFPDRYKKDPRNPRSLFVDSIDEVVVIKLHGSIDWFDKTSYNELEEYRKEQGFTVGTHDLIFERPQELGVYPLVKGPRFPNDPLCQIFRVQNIERLYQRGILFHAQPSLLNPSTAKILYSQRLKEFWDGIGKAGVLNFGMAIIGFSLPRQDDYARQVIYRLVKNYQTTYWQEEVWLHKKTPLVLVDLRKSAEGKKEYQRRYAFVDWGRAETYFGGFNEKALELLDRE
jgi:hypothetical protein